jgi:ABC-type glutathione transport system ATPase component
MLDPMGREAVLRMILELNSEGITTILITHFMNEAAQADRMIVMQKGELLADGAPMDIFSDLEMIKRAGLELPPVIELREKAGLPRSIMTAEDMAAELNFTTDDTLIWESSDDSVVSVTEAGVITRHAKGTVTLTVTGEKTNGFYPVQVGTLSGYASADYISLSVQQAAPAPAATAVPQPPVQENAYRVVVASDNGLNLRAQPSASSEVVYVLPYGMVLTVLGESENGFLHVRWANYEGYVAGDYVTPFGSQAGN